jgi:hypothetical protein
VRPTFEGPEAEPAGAGKSGGGEAHHSYESDDGENDRSSDRQSPVATTRRQHEEWDQWFAWAEDEDQEERPKSEIRTHAVLVLVHGVSMRVQVDMSVVLVGFDASIFAQGVPKAPNGICQPECDQRPSSEITTSSLHTVDFGHGHTEDHAEASEKQGRGHVAEATDRGYHESTGLGPGTCPGQDDEREVVVRAEEGVEKSNAAGCGKYAQTESRKLQVNPPTADRGRDHQDTA